MKNRMFFYMTFVLFGLFLTNSCIDELEVKNDYEFWVEHLPVPRRRQKGETAEIRFELVRSGRFSDAKYYVRYFQPAGRGELRLDGRLLIPNDSYELRRETFRMYYTSQSEEQQVIDITFYDNFRNKYEVSFAFGHVRSDDAGNEEEQDN
jgi:hypothetical protein